MSDGADTLPLPFRPDRGDSAAVKAFNRALMDILDGRGSATRNLASVTGLTVDAVKSRAKRARYDYPEREASTGPELEPDERRYLERHYRHSTDPDIQAFLGSIRAPVRKRPDWRSNGDKPHKRGKPPKARRRAG